MDYQKILIEIEEEIRPLLGEGKVADYIPALAQVDAKQFAISITLNDGTHYSAGLADKLFSIQSISKVFTFTMALKIYRDTLYERLGVEPSGSAFNSIVQLEYEQGKPRNPFINAGAINITDALINFYGDREKTFAAIISYIRELTDDSSIKSNKIIADSEMQNGFRNLSLANIMKSFNNLDNSVDEVVKTYFEHCSIEMNTKALSRAMLYLAHDGTDPINNKKYIT